MCEKVFPYKTEFDLHYKLSYDMMPVYTCSFCNKTAEKYTTFRSHCYRHITEGRYKWLTSTSTNLFLVITLFVFRCKDCPKGFSLQSMLQIHIIAKHSKAKPYKCEDCGKCFVTKSGLKIHVKKHKSNIKEDYPCLVCGKMFVKQSKLISQISCLVF